MLPGELQPTSVVTSCPFLPIRTECTFRIGELSSGGWIDTSSESAAVSERVATQFSAGHSSIIAIFRGEPGTNITGRASQDAIAASVQPLRTDPRVVAVVGYGETQDPRFISTAGDAAYVVVQLKATEEESVDEVAGIRALFAAAPGLSMLLTGYGPLSKDANDQSEKRRDEYSDWHHEQMNNQRDMQQALNDIINVNRRHRSQAKHLNTPDPDAEESGEFRP